MIFTMQITEFYMYINLYKSNRNKIYSIVQVNPKQVESVAQTCHVSTNWESSSPQIPLPPPQMILYLPHKLLIFATSLDSPNALTITSWQIHWLYDTLYHGFQEQRSSKSKGGNLKSPSFKWESIPHAPLQSPVETNATQWSIISCPLRSQ